MDKQQKLKIALPILAVVMAFVWGPVIFGSGTKGKPGNVSPSANALLPESKSGMDLSGLSTSGIRKKVRSSHEQWGQNPFMLKRAPKALYIEGIMWDESSPKAIINGEILGVGDLIESKLILEISPKSVTLSSEDGEQVIRLNQ